MKIRPGYRFYNPAQTEIGCSKDRTCSWNTTDPETLTREKAGTIGACLLGPSREQFKYDPDIYDSVQFPGPEKYADLIGVVVPSPPETIATDGPQSSSRRFLTIPLLLSIIAFYF
ncbi:hypothetical protein B9Z55_008788 [Caenorhabditis nigoni]|uniref:Uncharacterized protein n=1 Tax=Caenorhabditis nigoni TaxID=1611254 RepID=A0A2G5UP39_9PELO|nr:hypothetical protein B9Z55_008788 [Caenorhabditis nigoni]